MSFIVLVMLTALFIEGIGTYISILGLAALFAGSPVVITMAVALDVGKVVAVTFVYKNWSKINLLMKSYMTTAAAVLMLITSAGVFGYLSGEFQKAISGNNQQNISITALTEEQARLQKRKEQIDGQIAAVPANYTSAQRNRLINQFKQEQRQVTNRIAEIDKELPQLKIQNIGQSVKIGPILYVAEAFNTTPEQAVKWVILVIIFVFDPLAIALLLAGNYLIESRKKEQAAVVVPAPDEGEEALEEMIERFDQEQHGGEFALPTKLEEVKSTSPREFELEPIEELSTFRPPEQTEIEQYEEQLAERTEPPIVNDEPQVAEQPIATPNRPDEKLIAEISKPLADQREVITLEQLTPPRPSAFDKIDVRSGDVIFHGQEANRSRAGATYNQKSD